ncbi:MAG TPA: 6-phosphogluconolactonase [Gemmatimonadaceae bacterium]
MSNRPERIVVEARELSHTAASWIANAMMQAIRDNGRCSIALSGGKSPQPIYAELAASFREIPWGSVDIYFGDERAVPPGDPMSNYGMARASLLDRVPVPAANVHRMEGERTDLDGAARDYERLLPPAFDVLLLGIGPDGHTASLFPGAPTLDERVRRVVASVSPFPPPRRLTITPPVIAAARRTAMIVAARDKAGIVQRALEGPRDPHALPSQLALGAVWILDRDAASKLTPVPA